MPTCEYCNKKFSERGIGTHRRWCKGKTSLAFGGFTEIEDGDLKVSGDVIFQDETTLNTAIIPIPSGTILPFAGQTSPEGWLLCYGQEISREIYCINKFSDLFMLSIGFAVFNCIDLHPLRPM